MKPDRVGSILNLTKNRKLLPDRLRCTHYCCDVSYLTDHTHLYIHQTFGLLVFFAPLLLRAYICYRLQTVRRCIIIIPLSKTNLFYLKMLNAEFVKVNLLLNRLDFMQLLCGGIRKQFNYFLYLYTNDGVPFVWVESGSEFLSFYLEFFSPFIAVHFMVFLCLSCLCSEISFYLWYIVE